MRLDLAFTWTYLWHSRFLIGRICGAKKWKKMDVNQVMVEQGCPHVFGLSKWLAWRTTRPIGGEQTLVTANEKQVETKMKASRTLDASRPIGGAGRRLRQPSDEESRGCGPKTARVHLDDCISLGDEARRCWKDSSSARWYLQVGADDEINCVATGSKWQKLAPRKDTASPWLWYACVRCHIGHWFVSRPALKERIKSQLSLILLPLCRLVCGLIPSGLHICKWCRLGDHSGNGGNSLFWVFSVAPESPCTMLLQEMSSSLQQLT